MAIDMFHGTYVDAEDAKNYIDQGTIVTGCQKMDEASNKMTQIIKKVQRLKELCSRENLSVGGLNLDEIIENLENHVEQISLYINDLSGNIVGTTQRVVNRKQVILNEEAMRQDNSEIVLHDENYMD